MTIFSALVLIGCGSTRTLDGEAPSRRIPLSSVSPEQCISAALASPGADDESSYIIQTNDDLAIHFYLSPEFDDEVTVRPDGKITVRLAGELQARGLTPAQLAKSLDTAYSHELSNPVATVHVKSTPSRQVYVDGEVTHPGAFALAPDMSPLQAVAMAGGLTTEASAANAVLIRRDACGNPAAIKLDIERARRPDEPGDLALLMPGDLVYVPPSGIANLDLFVKHYIKNLLPVNPYLMMP